MTIFTFQGINAIHLIISAENYKNIDIIFNFMVLHARLEIALPGIALSALSFQPFETLKALSRVEGLSAKTVKDLRTQLNAER
jgi:hypothetical protein